MALGASAFDYDNDGDLDLVMTNGAAAVHDVFVEPELGIDISNGMFAHDPVRVWRNDGSAVFTEVSEALGVLDVSIGQGLITFDYDDDGDTDLLLLHESGAAPRLFRNDGGNAGHWLDVELDGGDGVSRGIGAVVTVTPADGRPPMVREVTASSGYLAQDGTARAYVSLGPDSARVASVHVAWPSGTGQTLVDLQGDRTLRVSERAGGADLATLRRDCIAGVTKAAAKLAGQVTKRFASCVAAATRGRLGPGETAADCFGGDPRGRIAVAKGLVEAAGADCAVVPRFGPRSAAEVNAAIDALLPAPDLFGPDPDAALADARIDPAAASCQLAMATHRIGGAGPDLARLEWDVKLYLALNGAGHDAAIVAWGLKRAYDSVRPISMIRHLGGNGQSSDPLGPAYDPDGLPLVPGLIEVITAETTANGGRHQGLAGHEGEIAVRTYPGPPRLPNQGPFGTRCIRAVEWVPYQKPSFVTPSFPGYVSGHSTFSRTAAEVLTHFTGDPFFPGGLGEFRAAAHEFLAFEPGPESDVVLQWGTHYDAADQAGLSRMPGGIHVAADDFQGRVAGSQVGIAAFGRAMSTFTGPP